MVLAKATLKDAVNEIEALQAASGGGQPAEDLVDGIVARLTESYNQSLIASASTRQYESATLPGQQLGVALPAAPFSEMRLTVGSLGRRTPST